jgi:hypothetical protein
MSPSLAQDVVKQEEDVSSHLDSSESSPPPKLIETLEKIEETLLDPKCSNPAIADLNWLKPSQDISPVGNLFQCNYCFALLPSEEVGKLHAFAHKTNCCNECDFFGGSLCAAHAPKYNNELPTHPHAMVLGRFGARNKPTYMYRCLNCPLVTYAENEQRIYDNYDFCDDCQFSAREPHFCLHLLKHRYVESTLEYGCQLCGQFFPTLDCVEEHIDNHPHSSQILLGHVQRPEGSSPYWQCPLCPFKGDLSLSLICSFNLSFYVS